MIQKRKYNIGTTHKNTQGYEFIINDILEGNKFKIKFLGYEGELTISEGSIQNKRFKNPYVPSVFGVGYLGIGEYSTRLNNQPIQRYNIWKHMMERSYDPKYHERFPTYKNVTTCKEWHNYQNFSKWFDENYIKDFHLDKDLLQEEIENKIYSPETCIFIPDFLNYFIKSIFSTNTSGYTGVTYDKPSGKWMVTIYDYIRKVNVNKGRYKNIEDAIEVYRVERSKNAELVKKRVRELNIYSEEIIQLIK